MPERAALRLALEQRGRYEVRIPGLIELMPERASQVPARVLDQVLAGLPRSRASERYR